EIKIATAKTTTTAKNRKPFFIFLLLVLALNRQMMDCLQNWLLQTYVSEKRLPTDRNNANVICDFMWYLYDSSAIFATSIVCSYNHLLTWCVALHFTTKHM